ncbi:unnamed protein product [Urochloa humidicola]
MPHDFSVKSQQAETESTRNSLLERSSKPIAERGPAGRQPCLLRPLLLPRPGSRSCCRLWTRPPRTTTTKWTTPSSQPTSKSITPIMKSGGVPSPCCRPPRCRCPGSASAGLLNAGGVHRRAADGGGVGARRGVRHLQGGAPRGRGREEAPMRAPVRLLLHRAVAGGAQLLPRLPRPPPLHLQPRRALVGAGFAAHCRVS